MADLGTTSPMPIYAPNKNKRPIKRTDKKTLAFSLKNLNTQKEKK
jgi:hypothetical protein